MKKTLNIKNIYCDDKVGVSRCNLCNGVFKENESDMGMLQSSLNLPDCLRYTKLTGKAI